MKLHFPSKSGMALATIGTFALGVGVFAFRAQADGWDKMTVLTVNQPVQVSDTYLDPGTYVFKLVDVGSSRHIVRILNADQSQVINTVMAIPNYRLQPTGDSRFTFWETPPGTARAMRAWFYPGDDFGQEFRYPKEPRLLAVARSSVTDQQQSSTPPPPPTLGPEPPASTATQTEAATQTETVTPSEPREPVVIAQNEPAPVIAQNQAPTPAPAQELPKTATPFPLIGLGGLLSFGLYGLVRLRRARKSVTGRKRWHQHGLPRLTLRALTRKKMNRRTAVRSLLAAGAGSVLKKLRAGASTTNLPTEDDGVYKLRSEVRLVLLDVSVKDGTGNSIPGLSQEQFTILENGRPQTITAFDHSDIPVTVGILVDESLSMTPEKIRGTHRGGNVHRREQSAG